MISEVYNMDCMDFMRDKPDKFFDLAIVDPPYGIDAGNYKRGNTKHGKAAAFSKNYGLRDWDKCVPNSDYFDELSRVSKNQIVWGANHIGGFNSSSCWIVWDKLTGDNGYADCELAYTSFDTAVRKFTFRWQGMLQGNMAEKEERIHPTQKPVQLYRWLLKNYANKNRCGSKHTDEYVPLCTICKDSFIILDTHLGSGSSRIAADEMGFNFYGTELDKDYFEAQELRFKQYKSQLKMFV